MHRITPPHTPDHGFLPDNPHLVARRPWVTDWISCVGVWGHVAARRMSVSIYYALVLAQILFWHFRGSVKWVRYGSISRFLCSPIPKMAMRPYCVYARLIEKRVHLSRPVNHHIMDRVILKDTLIRVHQLKSKQERNQESEVHAEVDPENRVSYRICTYRVEVPGETLGCTNNFFKLLYVIFLFCIAFCKNAEVQSQTN